MRDSTYYIGVDLGGTNLKSALFDGEFKLIYERRTAAFSDAGADMLLEQIAENIEVLLAEAELSTADVRCAGVGIPGLLNHREGVALFAANFRDWKDVPVAKTLSERLSIPVFIDNDVRVNLYGEWFFGAGKGLQNVVLLTLGTGLGAGIVLDGRVLYGATASAGEIGHMNMYREGRPCNCGSSGCFGRYVSARGLVQTFREKRPCAADEITAEMLAEAFDKSDPAAIEAFRETGEILGFGLANIINLYNPEMVIIGGGMANAGERLLAPTRESAEAHALKVPFAACSIVTAALGDSAGMFGAAAYAKLRLDEKF